MLLKISRETLLRAVPKKAEKKSISQDNKIIWVGRDLGQPAAQSRFICEVKLTQGFIQSGLENLQGWRLHNLCGLHDPLPDCPLRKKSLFYTQSNCLMFQLMLVAPSPPTMHGCEEPGSISSVAPLQLLGSCCQVPLKLSLLQLNKPLSIKVWTSAPALTILLALC